MADEFKKFVDLRNIVKSIEALDCCAGQIKLAFVAHEEIRTTTNIGTTKQQALRHWIGKRRSAKSGKVNLSLDRLRITTMPIIK